MFFDKNDNNLQNKKYLLVVVILMIISALGLTIANALGKKSELKNISDLNEEYIDIDTSSQDYSVTSRPDLKTDDRVIGNPNANLKIFVYENYDDIFSAQLAEDINNLIKENNNLAFVIRPFVSSSVKSQENALALSCLSSLNDWQNLRSEIMLSLESGVNGDLEVMVNKLGIDNDDFNSCLTKAEKSGKIEELKKETTDYQIFGSPTIFIGDELILGARPYDNYQDVNGDEVEGLKSIVDRVLASL